MRAPLPKWWTSSTIKEPEAIAEGVHVPIRALEREHRDPLDVALTVSYEADGLAVEVARELFDPRGGECLRWA